MDSLIQTWLQRPEWWFDATQEDDVIIANTFLPYLDLCEPTTTEIQGRLARIVLYDQIPFHMLRGQPARHVLAWYNRKALAEALPGLQDTTSLGEAELVFALLPLRHTNVPHMCWKAAAVAWQELHRFPKSKLICRFLRATYTNCPTEDQEAYVELAAKPSNSWDSWNSAEWDDVLDGQQPSETQTHDDHDNRCMEALRTYTLGLSKHQIILVSVSGGVDSMVALTLLVLLLGTSRVAAIHIDYCNRTNRERAFVQAWCHHLCIPLYVRTIQEIVRAPCMEHGLREVYESYTRKVRYAAYKCVMAATGADAVVLGHNRDDCFENILTNICHCEKLDNLQGMSQRSSVDGIQFHRPLLSISKQCIYATAQRHDVPFLQDSTPAWSQRGRIRDIVKPTLAQWNPEMPESLFSLSDSLQKLSALFHAHVAQVVAQTVNGNVQLDGKTTHVLLSNENFWQSYLQNLFPGEPPPSRKSCRTAVERIVKWWPDREEKKPLSLQLNQRFTVELSTGIMQVIHISIVSPSH